PLDPRIQHMRLGARPFALLVPLHLLDVEAGAVARRAPAVLRVVRKEARVELGEAAAARGARALHRIHLHLAPAPAAAADVQDALAELDRALDGGAQRLLVLRIDADLADRELDGVLAEAVEARPAFGRPVLALD